MYELSAELRGFVAIFNLDKNTPTAFEMSSACEL